MSRVGVLKTEAIPRAAARHRPTGGTGKKSRASHALIVGTTWRLLTSTQLALAVILGLAALTLAGTLIEQTPPGLAANPGAYEQWMARANDRYWGWAPIMDRFSLFDLFHSSAFRSLLGLLAVSITACTVSRWRGVWNATFHTPTRVDQSFFSHARYRAHLETSLSGPEAAARLSGPLSAMRYRVQSHDDGRSIALLAERNRFSRFATFLTHLGLLLILAGAIAGGVWGFKSPDFIVPEGSTRSLGMGTDISVRLDSFTDEYYSDGRPSDYRSDLVLLEHGNEVRAATAQVNSPLRYKGIAFHQSFFGQTAVIRVQDKSGTVLFDQGVPLAWHLPGSDRPLGSFEVPTEGLDVFVTAPGDGEGAPPVSVGEMRVDVFRAGVRLAPGQNLTQGDPTDVGGLSLTFVREGRFAGLTVVKDPGFTVIWIAAALMLVGMVARFYFPPGRLRVLCVPRPDGTSDVILGMPAQRDISLGGEFGKLQERVAKALGSQPAIPGNQGGNDGQPIV